MTVYSDRIQELEDICEQLQDQVDAAYKEMDEVWQIESNTQLEMVALKEKLDKSMFMSNLWIKGLLGIMTPKQRKDSFLVITRSIVDGFESKGWNLDGLEEDPTQLEHGPDSEG